MTKLRQKAYDALRKSEKFFKTDMVYLTKGGFWLTISQAVALISGLGLSIAMANLVPPEVFGNYKFALSLAGILGAFTLTGMGTAIIQAVSKGYEGILKAGFKTHLRWNIGITILSLFGALYYFYNNNNVLALSLLIIGSFSPLLLSSALYSSFLNGKKDFKTQSIYNLFRNLIPALSLISVIFVTDNPVIIILTYFLSNTAITLYFYFATLKKYKLKEETDSQSINYSKHLSLMNILSITAEYLDKILIFHYLGAIELAIYSFAAAPITQLKTPEKFIGELALPKFGENTMEELKRTLPRKVFLLMLIMATIVFLYIISAPYIYETIFPQYLDSVIYSQVLSLTLILAPSIYSQAMTAHMKTRELYTTRTILPIIKVLLFAILLPIYGIWGIVASLIIIQTLRFGLTSYLFHKTSNSQ